MAVTVRQVVRPADGQVELMVKAVLEEEVQLVLVIQVVVVVAAVMLAVAVAEIILTFLVLAEVHLVLMPHQIIQLQFSLTSVKEKLSSPHYVTFH